MCWVCNPMCGRCQPTPKKPGLCPDCNTINLYDRAEVIAGGPLVCEKCGKDLSDIARPKPIRCNYSGLVCIYPCGKSTSPSPSTGFQPCKRNTPPKRTSKA